MWTLVAILLIIWLLGLLTSYTFAGWIHVVPLIAIAIVVMSLVTKRKRKYARY